MLLHIFLGSIKDKEKEIHQLLKAQSVLMSCFAINSLEINKSLVDYSDMISFKPTDQRPMAMSDLLVDREKVLAEWFLEHKLTAKVVNNDKKNFYYQANEGAKTGDPRSQYVLALIYSDGFGQIQKDPEQALYWLKTSAAQRFAHAQCTLGYMYCLGSSIKQDALEGKTWLEAAARNGSKVAKWARSQQLESKPTDDP